MDSFSPDKPYSDQILLRKLVHSYWLPTSSSSFSNCPCWSRPTRQSTNWKVDEIWFRPSSTFSEHFLMISFEAKYCAGTTKQQMKIFFWRLKASFSITFLGNFKAFLLGWPIVAIDQLSYSIISFDPTHFSLFGCPKMSLPPVLHKSNQLWF